MLEAVAGRFVEDVGAVHSDGALVSLTQAGDAFHQLGLAVAIDARKAQDLALAHLQVQAAQDLHATVIHRV